MLAGWWTAVAGAAELDAELFGRRFRPKTVLGLTDPGQPGVLVVMASGERSTCEEVAAARASGGRTPTKAVVLATFNLPTQGSIANALLVVGPLGIDAMLGTATLETEARARGEKGAIKLSLVPDPAGREGALAALNAGSPEDHAEGVLMFTMCGDLVVGSAQSAPRGPFDPNRP